MVATTIDKSPILINGRYIYQRLTGIQRYAEEVSSRFVNGFELLIPPDVNFLKRGPLWEQLMLPPKVSENQVLWSPANTGPVRLKNQVVTIHDLSTIEHPEWFSPRFSGWYRFLLPRLANRVTKIITVSAFTKNRIIELFKISGDKIEVIPNGVSQKFFQINQDNFPNLINNFNLNKKFLLAVGSVEPRKNLMRLIQAWSLISSAIDEYELVIAGDTGFPFRDPDLGKLPVNVHMIGRVADQELPALYSAATAFMYPSIYEGFGLPVLEAMACGTPVIASGTTALPEVVGDAGLLVNPYDINEIADAIENVIEDSELREDLRQRGLQRARQFSWEKTASTTWDVLKKARNEITQQ